MTQEFDKAFEYLLVSEGGFTKGENDYGGATKYGLSINFLKLLVDKEEYYRQVLEVSKGDDITPDIVRQITIKQAKIIYYNYFWLRLRLNEIRHKRIAIKVLDNVVNFGESVGIDILQRACNDYFISNRLLTVDGIMGSITLARVNSLPMSDEHILLNLIKGQQIKEYALIVVNRPRDLVNLKGWILHRADRMPQ